MEGGRGYLKYILKEEKMLKHKLKNRLSSLLSVSWSIFLKFGIRFAQIANVFLKDFLKWIIVDTILSAY